MLSAVIPSERSQPAVPLAGQLTHQRFVRPGPLVLGTALLKAPARMEDRDRHDCYRPPAPSPAGGQIISAWLCMSPCRSDHIFATLSGGVRHMVSEDSGCSSLCARRYRPPPFISRASLRKEAPATSR